MLVPLDQIPADGRLWIFASARALTADEERRLRAAVEPFLQSWKAHGAPLAAGYEVREGQFLLVAVDESAAGASGCSVDAMVRVLSQLERELGVELTNHGPVVYRTSSGIARTARPEFAELARGGVVTPETVVFDNTLTRVGELREGRWEVPARDSWHARVFFSSQTV